ncbi:MAG TPA: TIGR03621 family F420-dependent LLM class oxidoreductase [Candidatus Dormibacteraeota bacterium]
MTKRPFRFGLGLFSVDPATFATDAKAIETEGWSTLLIPDHLTLDQAAPLPALAAAAALTERLRLGTFVLNNDLRHPAVLAQEAATVDLISNGRLELGLGAGWNQPEYTAIGRDFEPAGRRIERLEESLAVLKGLFADGRFSFDGKHYRIEAMDGLPKPFQRPHPPLLIGGGGRRLLSLAGRQADIVGFAPRLPRHDTPDTRSMTLDALEEKVGWVREAAGERYREIELNTYEVGAPVVVTDQARPEARRWMDQLRSAWGGMEMSEDDFLASPHTFIGSRDQLCEKLQMLRERFDISYVMVRPRSRAAFLPVLERLAGT